MLVLLGVVICGKLIGISPRDLHDDNLVFNLPVVVETILILTLPVLPPLLIARSFQNLSAFDLGFGRCSVKAVLSYFSLGVGIELLVKALALVISGSAVSRATFGSASVFDWLIYYGWFLFLLVLNSISEEFVYRAYSGASLLRTRLGNFQTAILSATMFSLVHFFAEPPTLASFFYRLSFGLLASLVFLKTKSIWTVVGLHTGLNIVANAFTDAASWKTGGLVIVSTFPVDLNSWVNFGVLAFASIFVLYQNGNRLAPLAANIQRVNS